MVTQSATFLEPFAGAAALSAAVRDLTSPAHVLSAGDAGWDGIQDLRDDVYLHLRAGRVR